jgi:hypothetical protein
MTRSVMARSAAIAVVINITVGCHTPMYRSCEIQCGVDGACPRGLACSAGLCVTSGMSCGDSSAGDTTGDVSTPNVDAPTGDLSPEGDSGDVVSDAQRDADGHLDVRARSTWGVRRIPVCWETSTWAMERDWVRAAVDAAWEVESAVMFVGWDTCVPDAPGVRIAVKDAVPGVLGIGAALDGVPGGVVMNFIFDSALARCAVTRRQCIEQIAVGIFGAALGLERSPGGSSNASGCQDGDLPLPGDSATVIRPWCDVAPVQRSPFESPVISALHEGYGYAHPVAAVALGNGEALVVANGDCGRLLSAWTSQQTWSPLAVMGGEVTSSAALVAGSPGTASAFVRGADGDLQEASFQAGAWSQWRTLGGRVRGTPAAALVGADWFIVARSESDTLVASVWSGSEAGWQDLGGALRGDPALVVESVGPNATRVHVFARGRLDDLEHIVWTNDGWSEWQSVGGLLHGSPAAVSRGLGTVDIFVRGYLDDLDSITWDQRRGWDDHWMNEWGELFGSPVLALDGQQVLVYGVSPTGGLAGITWNNTVLEDWHSVLADVAGMPAVVTSPGGLAHLFSVNGRGDVAVNSYRAGSWIGSEVLGNIAE